MDARCAFASLPTMHRPVQILVVALAIAAAASIQGLTPATATASRHSDVCAGHRGPGIRCQPGNGRRTQGGNGKASHAGWPAVTGIWWMAGAQGRSDAGTRRSDELLGLHGNDVLSGGPGSDIVWGDHLPANNNGWQHDILNGGAGNDWIYSSHGHNDITGGTGNDHIWGHYGHGTIDCGPGHDTVHVKRHPHYRLRACEVVLHH